MHSKISPSKPKFIFRLLASLSLVVTLLACQDHQTGIGTQRFRIKKKVFTPYGSSVSTTNYTYNSAGRLATVSIISSLSVANYTYTFYYDSQNRLTSQEGKNAASIITQRSAYEYDATGNLTSIRGFSHPNGALATDGHLSWSGITTFEYGPDKLPTKRTITFNGVITAEESYTYNDGNVVKTDYFQLSPSGPTVTTTFLNDDKPNLYYGLIGSEVSLPDSSVKTTCSAHLSS